MAIGFSHSTPATGAAAIFDLKATLKLQGWTILSSSDGTTYNAAGDQITVPGAGPGGMANNFAWWRALAPTGLQQITFQRSNVDNTQWRQKYSPAAGFILGAPSATQTPLASDEVRPLGAGTDAAPVWSPWLPNDNTYRWNCAADNAAPHRFYAFGFPTGGGAPRASYVFESLVGASPTDGNLVVLVVGQQSSANVFGVASMTSTGFPTQWAAYSTVAAVVPGGWIAFPCGTGNIDLTSTYFPGFVAANPITAKDAIMPIILGRRSTAPNPGYKGIFGWIKWTGTTRTTGDTLTQTTPRDRIVVGDCSLPWDGTVPVV